jgi:hypothetical protein
VRLGGPTRAAPRRKAPAVGTGRRLGLLRAGAVVWGGMILVGSLLPPATIAPAMPHFSGADLAAHAGAYAVLSLLAVGAWPGRRRLALGAAVLLLGVLIEVVQPLTGRSLSGLDMLADAAGVSGGLVAGWAAGRLRRAA